MSGNRFAAVVSLLAMACVPLASVADIPLAPPSLKGQTVTPVFEGWYRNPDGTFNLSFVTFHSATSIATTGKRWRFRSARTISSSRALRTRDSQRIFNRAGIGAFSR
jgi:hypothetical protein